MTTRNTPSSLSTHNQHPAVEGTGAQEQGPVLTRRAVLIGTLLTLAACTTEGSPSPTNSTPASAPATASKAPVEASPTASAERGVVWSLNWRTVRNPDLVAGLRREGEVFTGDPTADPKNPRSWQRVAVIGVPVGEVANEPTRSIAFWQAGAGDTVEYATLSGRNLPIVKAIDVDGRPIDVYAARVQIGPEATTFGFVSGAVNEKQANPSYAAESTRLIAQTVVTDPAYAQIPLV